jgi:dihydropteroate synthase
MLLQCGRFRLDLNRPRIMGIVNVTPDSFSDGGRHVLRDAALAHAHQLIADGADILDIGGESTRPGALPVGVQQELDRILPVIEGLHGAPVPLSVDTQKPEVMRAALARGASIINDIHALQDPEALKVAAATDAGVCLMHMRGEPQTMQQAPQYQDVVAEVRNFLRARIAAAEAAGIPRARIAIDPGFGFGKALVHNLALLRNLGALCDLGVPVLAGLSRKTMLGALTGQDVEHRVHASVAAALMAVERGARILRVHDVRATADALKIYNAVNEAATGNQA